MEVVLSIVIFILSWDTHIQNKGGVAGDGRSVHNEELRDR